VSLTSPDLTMKRLFNSLVCTHPTLLKSLHPHQAINRRAFKRRSSVRVVRVFSVHGIVLVLSDWHLASCSADHNWPAEGINQATLGTPWDLPGPQARRATYPLISVGGVVFELIPAVGYSWVSSRCHRDFVKNRTLCQGLM
jgi:hypothetical protein